MVMGVNQSSLHEEACVLICAACLCLTITAVTVALAISQTRSHLVLVPCHRSCLWVLRTDLKTHPEESEGGEDPVWGPRKCISALRIMIITCAGFIKL